MPRAAHRQHVLAAVVGVRRENAPKGAIKISPRLSLALVIHRSKSIRYGYEILFLLQYFSIYPQNIIN